ncbi:MAG: hypothetical protein WCK15_20745 [Pirellula sp.]
MNRIFYLALTSLYLFFSFTGCKPNLAPGVDVAHATLVTFEQFREVNKDEKVFYWLGCDAKFQYFRTKKGFYRITTSSKIVDERRLQSSKRNFEGGVKIGEISENVMIGDNNKFGAPPNGVDPNLSYRPLD